MQILLESNAHTKSIMYRDSPSDSEKPEENKVTFIKSERKYEKIFRPQLFK